MAFPTDVPSLNDPTASNKLSNPSHSQLHQDVNANLEAGLTKIGTGATTPTSGALLVGSGAGTSAWDTSPANITLDTPTLNTPDLNGTELILDADADTSITADTDDQIDIKIAGADDFRLTANTLTALAGSTIATDTIAETTAASGVTVDGLLLKDSKLATNNSVVTSNITDAAVTSSKIDWTTITSTCDVYAYRSSALTTTASTITKLVYNSEVYDVGSNYDTTTAEFTAPVNGYYNVLAALETTSSSNTYIMLVYVNGVQVTRGPSTVSPSAITSVLMTDRLRLAAGDKLDIRYFILNALTVVTTQSETYLKVSLDKRY